MYYRRIRDDLQVALCMPQHADALFTLADENREYLKAWLSWLDAMQTVEDTRQFIQSTQDEFAKGAALHHVLLYQGSLVGVVSFNSIDKINGIGQIGYWLGEPYTQRGLMTAAVADLIHLGFNELCLERVEIRCAVENWRSRAIPERLGFELEGTLRSVQKVGKARYAHAVYGLLASEQLSY